MSRERRILRAVPLTVLASLTLTGVVWAHTALVRSVPASGDHLAGPPSVIVLEFNEAVDPATSRIALVGPAGDTLRLAVRRPADSASRVLEADVPKVVDAGAWRVEWRLIGADGHAVTGRFEFHVDSIPAPPPVVPETSTVGPATGVAPDVDSFAPESPLGVLIRFASLASLVSVIGAAVMALVLVPRVDTGHAGAAAAIPERTRLRLGAIVRGAARVLAVVLPASLVMQGAALAGSVGAMTVADVEVILRNTTWGTGWSVQAVGLLLVLAASWGRSGALAVRESRWRLIAAGGVLLAVGASAMGHPAALPGSPIVAMGLDGMHAIAAGTWAGGLGALTIAVLPPLMALPSEHRVNAVRGALRTFTPIALAAATVLVATGLVGAWWQLEGDVSALAAPGYGRWLVAKLAAVGVVAAFGLWHWRVAQPRLDEEPSLVRLRRTVRVELVLMVLVLVLTAVLTGTPPGSEGS